MVRYRNDIAFFMNLNYLKLDIYKTNVKFLAKTRSLKEYSVSIRSQKFTSNSNNKLKLLGLTTNQSLSCKEMVQQCLRSCHFHLFKLRSVRQ